MKKLTTLSVVMVILLLLVLTACQSDNGITQTGSSPSPAGTKAPDDLVNTPGGTAYRAGSQQERVENNWPAIETASVALGTGLDVLNIHYRAYIESKAGETRNNIIGVSKDGGLVGKNLSLYTVGVPEGLKITILNGVGLPGALAAVLAIEIKPGVTSGEYTFKIGIEIDARDYSTIPCTVKVIK